MSNFSFWLWIALSAGLLLLIAYAAITNSRKHSAHLDFDEIVLLLRPVDVQAFSRLLHPREDAYMRETGGKTEYANFRRKQIRIAMEYLRRMSHNAGLMQSIGHSRIRAANGLVVAQAEELITAGVNVRLYSMMGLAILHFWRIFGTPSHPRFNPFRIAELQKLLISSVIPAYEAFKAKTTGLAALLDSTYHDALLQNL
ncbi:MAG TPA: hypothetical protein VNW97_20420 [Candidatus Saccharimonadales bacterium]|jgi:hypothetical protein|nr:hypothetical protein [Candidatus Saccharimonadales bacterium]